MPDKTTALFTNVGGTGVLSFETTNDDFVIKLILKVGIQTLVVFQASVFEFATKYTQNHQNVERLK